MVAHLGDKQITKRVINYINLSLAKKPIWIYDERDVYGYIRKPLPKTVLKFASYCDLVCVCNFGTMMKRFIKNGSRRIEYLPHCYDYNFGSEWNPTFVREFDIIMIANRSKSKIPFLSMPGIKEREQIVLKFAKQFGSKFAIFGKGWDKFPCNKGPINFFDQEKILRNSWLSIGMDHFYTYDGYYSDRLPIALVSGIPHLTYKTPGVDKLFEDKKDLFFFETTEEALSLTQQLLKLPKEELIEMGQVTRKKFLDSLSEVTRYKKMFNMVI